jgi:hypothetical protein
VKALACAALGAFAIVASAATDFMIETELSPQAVYVGAEAILRVRLLRAPGVPYGVLRPPALGDSAELWSPQRSRWFDEIRDGVTWQVHERTYLIMPRRTGLIDIPGAELEGPLRHALTRDARRPPSALRGPRIALEVRPRPAEEGEPWLPARLVTLEESWSQDPSDLPAGTAVTRTLTLRAEGIPAQRLPRLEMAGHPALRAHHDRPELATDLGAAGTVGRLVQRVVLVPLDEGEVILPELRVRWWDLHADAPRVAALAPRTLRLRAASAPPAPPAPADSPDVSWQAGAAALVIALVAWLWWRARTQPLREARKELRNACRKNDAARARDALLQWRRVIEPGAPAPLVQHIGEAWDAQARAELWALDAALYARRAWDGRKFWRSVRPWLRRKATRPSPRPSSTAPLFRLQATGADPSGRTASKSIEAL